MVAELPGKTATVNSVEQACTAFVTKVQNLKQVKCVYLVDYEEDKEEGPVIWTIIDAPAFDRAAYEPVYRAHVEIRRALAEPLVDFRVVNLKELPNRVSVSAVVPSGARLLWRR